MIVTETTSFEEHLQRIDRPSGGPQWLQRLRTAAAQRFSQVGLPSSKQEAWRFTNISPIAKQRFEPALAADDLVDATELVAQNTLDPDACQLVFVNGHFVPALSSLGTLPAGLTLRSLADDLQSADSLAATALGRQAKLEHSPLTALNTALFRDGVVIAVDDAAVIQQPIYLLLLTEGQSVSASPRNLIRVGRAAQLCLVETHVGGPGQTYLANHVSEIELDESARVDHYKLQSDSIAGYHIASTYVSQQAASRYRNHYFAFGGAISRNELLVFHSGEQIETVLNGLYMVSGKQLADCRTRIDHAMPHCESHEMYKGILDNQARGVFNGKIHVHPDAQKTDAKQSNQALLLSDDAVIDTKPELEIYADDVRCTHGATVGELDAQALFYLRSRGVPEPLARKVLIFAFANDVVQGVEANPLKKRLESVLLADHGLPGL